MTKENIKSLCTVKSNATFLQSRFRGTLYVLQSLGYPKESTALMRPWGFTRYMIYMVKIQRYTGYFFCGGRGGEAKGYGIFLDQKLLEYGILRYPLPPCPQPYNGVSLILLSDWRRFTHREILLKK